MIVLRSSIVLAVLAALILPAQAQVAFEPGVGGSVSAESVQKALGWRDRQLRAMGGEITFSYEMIDRYFITCTTRTSAGEIVESSAALSRAAILNVNSAPKYRQGDGRPQLSGYDLMGFKQSEGVRESIPLLGERCRGYGGAEGRITRSELEQVRDSLYVHHGDAKALIWYESY